MLFGLLGDYFSQVKQSVQRGLVDEVRAYARSSFATGHCTIERCAARLKTSARTIQRRLTDEGLRFSEIVEQERIAASQRALVQTDNALSDIAYSLGYSDQSSFGRAFKRWTGITPQAYREQHKGPSRLH
jgi:AraC-like DNA-binding protein